MSPPNWPTTSVQIEFVPGTWTTLSGTVRKFSVSRGRQYELATPQAGTLGVTIDCSDGNLDPTNTASAYYPNVMINKRIRVQLTTAAAGTRSIFTGYVERYPQRWGNAGNYQFTELVAADALAPMGRTILDPIAYPTISYYTPTSWWALDDAAGSVVAGSRTGELPLTVLATHAIGSAQAGPFLSFGATISSKAGTALGMEGTSGAGFTPGPNALTVSPADMTVLRSPQNAPVLPYFGGWTIYCSWSSTAPNLSGVAPNGSRVAVYNAFDGSSYIALGVDGNDRVATLIVDSKGMGVGSPGTSYGYFYPAGLAGRGGWNTGQSHFHAVSLSVDRKTIYYVISDAAAIGYATKNDGSIWDFSNITSFSIGGEFRPYRNGNFAFNAWTGVVNNVAMFKSEILSNGGITDIVNAEHRGYYGDDTVVRFQRLMPLAGRSIPYGGSLSGNSKVQSPVIKGKSLTAALTDLAADEYGTLFVDGDGIVTFINRQARINPTARLVFTDQGADGPGVYRYTNLTTDFDAQYLLNDVTVSRNNGVTARSFDTASKLQNGTYSAKITTNIVDDQQAIDRAAYTVGRYSQPLPRMSSLQINPGNAPVLWPLVMGLELNIPVKVVRTPAQGSAFTRICWIEQITYSADASTGVFTVTLQLSPADLNNYLVLDDPVRGVLDAGNKLAY